MIMASDFKKPYSEQELRSIINDTFIVNKTLNITDKYYFTSEDWYYICTYQELSEDFIREFSDQVDWARISKCQNLSESFIREFQNSVDWYNISLNEKLQVSDKFCEEFDHKLGSYEKVWRINGKTHRILGPAFRNQYWYRGQKAENVNSMKEYKRWLKLRAFI